MNAVKLNLPVWEHPPVARRLTMDEYLSFLEEGLQSVDWKLADQQREADRISVPFRLKTPTESKH
jgi:hypothetical protein